MKQTAAILILLSFFLSSKAAHIAGGELQYQYLGPGSGNTDRYLVTMRLFRECSSNGPKLENEIVNVGAYNPVTKTLSANVILQLVGGGFEIIQLKENTIPCLVGSPNVCYQVATYTNEISLPRTAEGYILAWARCCRANGLMNASGQIGAIYTTSIPGTSLVPVGNNSSPQFVVKDTALVCGDNDFVLDFGATDADGDSLSYAFCDAYAGGSSGNQATQPQPFLNLQSIPYSGGYSGAEPLGPGVVIAPATGIISGIAPKMPGRYVVNVCVTEWRNGVAISQHRKDFILKVGDCNITAAKLLEQYINCDSFTVHLENENNSSAIKSWFWDFGLPSASNDTSNLPQPVFTYPDTGVYQVKLIINRNEECSDTAVAPVKIFPGFTPSFTIQGSCYQNPFQFTDASTASYGTINRWRWDFGEEGMQSDTSIQQNPSYQYNTTGQRLVRLTVSSNKGCSGQFTDTAMVFDKPYLNLPFRDTLICNADSVVLQAEGSGVFSWSPDVQISNTSIAAPTVYPSDTTWYFVELNENACVARDSIRINVIDFVTAQVSADTAVCQGDSIKLHTTSNALQYSWSPAEGLSNPTIVAPDAAPGTTTSYLLTATVGKCFTTDSITIRVSPYPVARAGNDTAICNGDKLQLEGFVQSNSFKWSPSGQMLNGNTLQPFVAPNKTSAYILTATGYQECPKAVTDTVTVIVRAPVQAFAGNDTSVVVGQPLVLHATGGAAYLWSPGLYLDAPDRDQPTAVFGSNVDSVRYTVNVTTAEGCTGLDEMVVLVYKTVPDIFIPDAFTPNNDGLNDLFYPVVTGMKQFDFFKVYNRYGQLLFSSQVPGKAWDGSFAGKPQPPGTYVYMAQAVNYKGETVFKKGTVVLIR